MKIKEKKVDLIIKARGTRSYNPHLRNDEMLMKKGEVNGKGMAGLRSTWLLRSGHQAIKVISRSLSFPSGGPFAFLSSGF